MDTQTAAGTSAEDVWVSPASFAQRRLWFLDQLEPGSAAYVLAFIVSLEGPADTDAVRQAVDGIVERHEALRTTFRVEGGEVLQVVHPSIDGVFEHRDVSALVDDVGP